MTGRVQRPKAICQHLTSARGGHVVGAGGVDFTQQSLGEEPANAVRVTSCDNADDLSRCAGEGEALDVSGDEVDEAVRHSNSAGREESSEETGATLYRYNEKRGWAWQTDCEGAELCTPTDPQCSSEPLTEQTLSSCAGPHQFPMNQYMGRYRYAKEAAVPGSWIWNMQKAKALTCGGRCSQCPGQTAGPHPRSPEQQRCEQTPVVRSRQRAQW